VEADRHATRAFEAHMKKQKLARDKREASHRASEQSNGPARNSRTHVPSASLNERREDGPHGNGRAAAQRKRALATKARREAKQARAVGLRA
jgi:hypothetical protein